MVVDVGVVKKHIKPKADSTLYNMRKTDLIEYVRTLEHNYNVAVSFNENQAKYIESLGIVEVVRCKECKHRRGDFFGTFVCRLHKGLAMVTDESFCSYGERRTDV